jgi:hypothetical protein
MNGKRLLDREEIPTPERVKQVIGREVYPVWEDVKQHLNAHYPDCESEWRYYNPQHGWGLRFRIGSQQLCMVFPERGSFTALITLTPHEDEAALKKIRFFNARIRDLLNQPSTLPQGRWLWMQMEDHTDFVGFKLIMEIKTAKESDQAA